MKQVVWKFDLQKRSYNVVRMPRGCTPLHSAYQNGQPKIWVLCDPDAEKVPYVVNIIGTGMHDTIDFGKFVNTFQLSDYEEVYHVFVKEILD